MSPKEPLPILRPMRYLFPTRRSYCACQYGAACSRVAVPGGGDRRRGGQAGRTIVVISYADLNLEALGVAGVGVGVCAAQYFYRGVDMDRCGAWAVSVVCERRRGWDCG
jgi:hypothetical protein